MLNLYCVCGEWKSNKNKQLNFLTDFEKGASVFEVDEDVKFKDLQEMVIEDFEIDRLTREVKLSYELPSRMKVSIKDSRPAFLCNDRQVRSFINMIKQDAEPIRLCVTVRDKNKLLSHATVCSNIQSVPLMDLEICEMEKIPGTHSVGEHSIAGDVSHSHINQPEFEKENVFSVENVVRNDDIREVESIQGRIPVNLGWTSHIDDVSLANEQQGDFVSVGNSGSNYDIREVDNIRVRMTQSLSRASHIDVSHANNQRQVNRRSTTSDSFSFSTADKGDYSSLLNPIPDLPPIPIGLSHSTGRTDDIYVNRYFKNKTELMLKMRKWALKHKFEFKSLWSNKKRVVLGCVDDKCSWKMRAKVVAHSDAFIVTKFVPEHTCDTNHRNTNHRQASAKTLASLICSGYVEKKDGLRPKQIVDLVRMTHGVQINYKKAWRTKEHAEILVRGNPEESYHNLSKWLFKVQEKNPGSKVFLEIDDAAKFKYAFLALGQSLRGFKYMRRVIAIDGTFLKAKFKGTLIGASAQDGNFDLYPLAFGIVDSENEDSWSWFLRGLKSVIPDGEDLVFVSDRALSIASALSAIYPLAHHGICRVHLIKNIESQFGKKAVTPTVIAAADAYTKFEFNESFSDIKIRNPSLATYLEKADFTKWARCYSPANRYNIMTTNIVESLNSMLNMPTEMPVISLVETIRLTLTSWFHERREKASKLDKYATPKVTEMIAERNEKAMVLDVYQVDEFEFEVKDDTHKYVVHLENKQCTCNVFDIDRIPCIHAIAAAKCTRKDEYKLVDDFYTKEIWVKAYSESIHPCGDLATCSLPDDVSAWFCGPPATKQSSGTPPEKRKRAAGEFGVPGSKSQGHKCSRCGIGGHNKSTCKNQI